MPWLPAEAVMTPTARRSGDMRMSLFSAPRTLKARMGWTDSSFRCTSQPASTENARECCSGVGWRCGARSRAACSTAAGLLLLAFSFVGQVQGELLQTRVDGYDLWAAHLAVPRLRVSAFAGRDAVQVVAAHG